MKIRQEDIPRIIRYKQGLNNHEIQEYMGISKENLDKEDLEFSKKLKQGLTYKEIGELFDVTDNTVYRAIRKYLLNKNPGEPGIEGLRY